MCPTASRPFDAVFRVISNACTWITFAVCRTAGASATFRAAADEYDYDDDPLESGRRGGDGGGGVDPYHLADPQAFLDALDRVPFLVSLEFRHTAVTDRGDR
ncbi:hypothetical protein, partial [Catenulispora pinisilvae]|uniref:hypothetical protein n=1 Tax=Catenulispora pinisilvae TaxID=2705253 RepID=UPI00189215B5